MNLRTIGIEYAENENYEEAALFLQKAYDNGDVLAINDMGVVFEKHHEYKKARECYEYCMKYCSTSVYNLGNLYEQGWGVDQSYETAWTLYMRAAAKGYYRAYYKLALFEQHGYLGKENPKKAFEYASKGSQIEAKTPNDNDGACTLTVGYYYEYGIGTKLNYKKALKYYSLACNLGNRVGFYNLAMAYLHGRGAKKDTKKAFNLLLESAKRHYPPAFEKLYEFYCDNEYGMEDQELAEFWLYKALDHKEISSFLIYAERCLKGENSSKTVDIEQAERAIRDYLRYTDPSFEEEAEMYKQLKQELPSVLDWDALEANPNKKTILCKA